MKVIGTLTVGKCLNWKRPRCGSCLHCIMDSMTQKERMVLRLVKDDTLLCMMVHNSIYSHSLVSLWLDKRRSMVCLKCRVI